MPHGSRTSRAAGFEASRAGLLPLLVVAAVVAAPALAGPPPAAPSGAVPPDIAIDSQSPELEAVALAVPVGATLRLRRLGQGPGEPAVDLTLERFEVFAPGAEIVVHRGSRTIGRRSPPNAYFRGRVDGEPDSRAVLTIRGRGGTRGLLHRPGGRWVVGGGAAAAGPAAGLDARRIGDDEMAERTAAFSCTADHFTPHYSAFAAGGEGGGPAQSEAASASFTARVAIETDHEFFDLFGNAADATDYVGDLVAYASSLYAAEVDTALEVASISLWAGGSDPWTQDDAGCGLYEFGRHWNDNHAGEERALAHFLSGKPLGGVAWVGVLCRGAFNVDHGGACAGLVPQLDNYGGAYAFSGGLSGSFDLQDPGIVWDVMVVAHETGHNFRSPHTHCYAGLGGNSEPVDGCYSGQCGGSGCFCGSDSLPGGCPGTGQGCGTVMSYCHLLSGGLGNIGWTLGAGHPYGVEPDRVPVRMLEHVVSSAAAYPGCLDPTNGPPVAADDEYSIGQYLTLDVAAPGVLGNDSDPDGDPLTASLTAEPANGSVDLRADGSFTYTPDPAFSGFDSFDYTAGDGRVESAPATVTVEVIPCAGDPDLVLQDDVVTGSESHQACQSITVGPALEVAAAGDLSLEAGVTIGLQNGFSVQSGGTVSASISP